MREIAVALSCRTQGTLTSNTETHSKEKVKAIIARSGVKLPKANLKWLATTIEKIPIMG